MLRGVRSCVENYARRGKGDWLFSLRALFGIPASIKRLFVNTADRLTPGTTRPYSRNAPSATLQAFFENDAFERVGTLATGVRLFIKSFN